MEKSKPTLEVLILSSLAGGLSTIATQPIEVLKTRHQAQTLLYAKQTSGIFEVSRQLWREGRSRVHMKHNVAGFCSSLVGARIFWSGTVPALCRCVPGVCLYFMLLNALTSRFLSSGQPTADAFLLGFTTRSIIACVLSPFSVVKMHAEAGFTVGRSTLQSLVHIYRENRLPGLFHGLPATLARDSPYSGLYLVFYSQMKVLLKSFSTVEHTPEISTLSALAAAILATTITQPADVLRASRQLHSPPRMTRLADKNLLHVFREVVLVDGIFGLWRGLNLRLSRRAIFACITWTLFDSIPLQTR